MPDIKKLMPLSGMADRLAEVHQDGFDHPWSVESFDTLIAQPGMAIWGAMGTDPEDLVGFALVRTASVEVEVITIAVRRSSRRQGVAEALLRAIFRDLDPTCETAFLEVDSKNVPARALYAKLGFEKVGERPKYYSYADGSASDALVLSRKFGSG